MESMTDKIKKATRHTNQNEGLIFEKSSPGKRAFELPPLDVPAADSAKSLGTNHHRDGVEGFPEVSEIEVIRHFTRGLYFIVQEPSGYMPRSMA